jgi:Ca-activated chloride channel family protein
MLAEDLYPNRLGKAKQLVSDVVDILEGDRVGLLVFAGATAIKSPLTLDYNYFKQALSSIGPEDVNRGGTHIGDAIRMVSERLFYDQDNKFRDVILITDGEDHESFPIEAAKSAAKKGIKIHTVGLGDPDGANIPIRKRGSYRLLTYNNSTVRTKLDESTLRRIAEITRGVFIPVRTNLVDLANLYKDYIVTAEKRELESKKSKLWSELFQFFLGIAILSIMVESLIGERGRKAEYRFFFKES